MAVVGTECLIPLEHQGKSISVFKKRNFIRVLMEITNILNPNFPLNIYIYIYIHMVSNLKRKAAFVQFENFMDGFIASLANRTFFLNLPFLIYNC